jgi:hypothetical protein
MTVGSVVRLPRAWFEPGCVDEWGRDAQLIEVLTPAARLRWDVNVGGTMHLPKRGGGLLVTNARRFSLSAVYGAWALSQAIGRPVRFAGRLDIAPIGPFMQRVGGLLSKPEEIRSALGAGELIVVSTRSTYSPRRAGAIDVALVGAAVTTGTPVLPVATISSPFGRAARVEIGPPVRPTSKRRGPLGELELAELTQRHLQRLLDGLGGLHTGVAPVGWLAEG